MNRICFTLRVKQSLISEYKKHHAQLWPEMIEALQRTGWHNYSLFLADDGLLIGYFETPGSLAQALEAMASEPINARWQDVMAPYFESTTGAEHPDTQMIAVESIFYLP